jgi:biotin operon repressor
MNNFASQLAVFAAALVATSAAAADTDWSKVDQALGRKGADQPGGVHKFSFPRSDLNVVVDGVELKPALALGSWVAFQPAGSDAMCMGDLVLTETEISAVMKRLVDDGIEISAVHNHLLRTSQPVVYMHIAGHGEPAKLADTIHAALALSKTPLTQAPPAPAASPAFDTASLDAALGFKGTVNGEVYQFSIPRAEAISEGGMSIPPSMGTAIGINFQATSAGKVATTGDFVLLGKEVNPVVKALRDHGIEVTALHSHMIDDSPHLYFMHFWANDEVKKVAQGLRAALDLANIKRGS